MDLDSKIVKIHDRAFDYEITMKNLNRTQDEIDTLRGLMFDFVPQFITDKQVSMESRKLCNLYYFHDDSAPLFPWT